MKKLLLSVVAIVAITVGGWLAADHYQNYQNKNQAKQQVVVDAKASEIAQIRLSAAAETREWKNKYSAQVTECQKGKAAYDSLSAFSKSKMAAPQCGPEVVE